MSFTEYMQEKEKLDEGVRYNLSDEDFIEFVKNKEVDIDSAIEKIAKFHEELLQWKEDGWNTVEAFHEKEIIPMKA